jgi:hypothetical protein
MRAAEQTGIIRELAIVALRNAMTCDEGIVPAGSKGTVVHVYRDGAGYEVEFAEPFRCVLTTERGDIEPA